MCPSLGIHVIIYLTAERLKKGQARMACDLADESALFVEVHSVKVRLVASEDLIGLWDNPDLEGRKSQREALEYG